MNSLSFVLGLLRQVDAMILTIQHVSQCQSLNFQRERNKISQFGNEHLNKSTTLLQEFGTAPALGGDVGLSFVILKEGQIANE